MMSATQHAQYLIIGGGIIGCSIAYHLTRMGATDVVILEKSGLTHGATWHAAGLVGQLRSSRNTTRMLQRSVELYDRLEEETGQAIEWKKVGSLRLAASPDRMLEVKRLATMARSFGLEMQVISPTEAKELFPLIDTAEVLGAAYLPTDGYIDPSGVCQALAAGARKQGARIVQGVRVEAVHSDGRTVTGVDTDNGSWTCDTMVLAAGMWSREIGALSGVNVPACAVEHQYIVTEPIADMPKDMPTLRDPDRLVYYKPDAGRLVVGGYEPDTIPFGDEGVPRDFGQELLPGNMDRFLPLAEKGAKVTPVLNEVGIREVINGPIPYSADGDFIMGRVPELDNYFVASGFLYGIAAGGGAGQMMAEWILDGRPSLDLWPLDVRRFLPHHNTRRFIVDRAVEHYGGHYLLHKPGEESGTARGLRRSPLYGTLKHRRAVYGSKAGWERPNWFAPEGTEIADALSFDRRATNWFPAMAEEHRAVRERVALIDQSSFAKLEVWGRGALDALQTLAVSNLDKPVGAVVYTQLCNERGGIECDLTIIRTGEDRFYVVTGSGFGAHDFHWITTHMPDDGSVAWREVTSAYAVVNLCGPRARTVLQQVADGDVSNAAQPFATARELDIGAATVLAARIGYVGELGWELHIPTEFAGHVYGLLREAGEPHGIADAGYRAIDSLRMEKGYLYWSADITPDYTPYEAGLGFKVALKSKGDFLGKTVLQAQKESGPTQRLCTFTVDDHVSLYGGEPVFLNGEQVGLTTSANYGHTVGKEIAYSYLPAAAWDATDFEIESFGERYKAARHDRPLYDPDNERLKA